MRLLRHCPSAYCDHFWLGADNVRGTETTPVCRVGADGSSRAQKFKYFREKRFPPADCTEKEFVGLHKFLHLRLNWTQKFPRGIDQSWRVVLTFNFSEIV